MKKLIVTTLAVLFASSAFAAEGILGESLDSGLGALSTSYNAAEYNYKKNADGTVVWPFAI